MKLITEITSEAKQKLDITTELNDTFELILEWSDQQQGWFYSFTYEDLAVNGARVTTHPNFLRAFKNIIPFGLGIQTDDFSEPILQDDFKTGRVQLLLLNESEVEEIEANVYFQ